MASLNVQLTGIPVDDRICGQGGRAPAVVESPEIQEIDLSGNWVIAAARLLGGQCMVHPASLTLGICLVGWMVPAILSIVDGFLLPGGQIERRCFVFDLSMYGCFFLGIPVILFAEFKVSAILSRAIRFGKTRAFLAITQEALNHEISRMNRLARSTTVNLLSLLIAYCGCLVWGITVTHDHVSTWFAFTTVGGESVSLAGWWAMLISFPTVIYVITVWTLKAILWSYFLVRITKHPVQINPLHPDRCGGLSFLANVSLTWSFLVASIGFVTVCDYANYVYIQGASPVRWDLLVKLLSYLVVAPLILVGQLVVWTPHLFTTKKAFLREMIHFGKLHADSLRSKIRESNLGKLDPLELDAHFEGIASGGEAFNRVKSMRLLPFDVGSFLKAMATVCVPLTPLLLPYLPSSLREVVSWLVK